MNNLYDIASHIYFRYMKEFGEAIDEMKFHKLMYFSQRESLVQTGELLFKGTFYGWKFGPILKEIRKMYKNNDFSILDGRFIAPSDSFNNIMNKVFTIYAPKNSWTLSMLSHNEISWKNSRIGIPDNEIGDIRIKDSDIKADAERIKFKRTVQNILNKA